LRADENKIGGSAESAKRPKLPPQHGTGKRAGTNGGLGCYLDEPEPKRFRPGRFASQALQAGDEVCAPGRRVPLELRLENEQASQETPRNLQGIRSRRRRRIQVRQRRSDQLIEVC
jgi:hypothetical protein